MAASLIRSIENRPIGLQADGVFGDDALLLCLASDSRLVQPMCPGKTMGDDVLDALEFAQAKGWEC